VPKKIYLLYSRKIGEWEVEFAFRASGIEEAKSFSYSYADREGIDRSRIGIKEHIGSAYYPILVTSVRPNHALKIANERASA